MLALFRLLWSGVVKILDSIEHHASTLSQPDSKWFKVRRLDLSIAILNKSISSSPETPNTLINLQYICVFILLEDKHNQWRSVNAISRQNYDLGLKTQYKNPSIHYHHLNIPSCKRPFTQIEALKKTDAASTKRAQQILPQSSSSTGVEEDVAAGK